MFTVKDIMTDHIVFVHPDATVERAVELMLRHGVSGLPVVDDSDQPLGVITEFDVLGLIDDVETEHNKVHHYMSQELHSIDADATILELAAKFQERPIRRFPVVEDGRLVGIVSRRELIRLVHDIRIKVHHETETAAPG